MPATLTATWEEHNFSGEIPIGIRFKSFFSDTSPNQWLTAEFAEPLQLDSGHEVKYVHFLNLYFFDSGFIFHMPDIKVIYLSTKVNRISVKISTLRPIPVSSALNRRLNSMYDRIHAHVYYYPPDETVPHSVTRASYLKYVVSSWSEMKEQIHSLLVESGKGIYGQVVGVLSEVDVVPKFYPVGTFFQNNKLDSFGREMLVIFISSFEDFALRYGNTVVSSKNVPSVPKAMILMKAGMYPHYPQVEHSLELDRPSRRLFSCLFNGGVPVNLFDMHENVLGTTLSSKDFERICLKLSSGRNPVDYGIFLSNSIDLLKSDLFTTSNEATWRSFFWDRVIADLFQKEIGQMTRRNFHLQSEWSTTELFPKLEPRRVDFIAAVKPHQTDFPIFLVEIGTERFSTTVPHKDYSKLLCQMSLICNRLALDLSLNGRSPMNARVYGVWIGDGTIQFAVAHPVLTERSDGFFEIHTHLSYDSHWLFHLFSETVRSPSCDLPCCNDDGAEPSESILSGRISDLRLLGSPHTGVTGDIVIEEEPEGPFLRSQETPEAVTITTSPETLNVYRGFLNVVLFQKLHAFIKIVIDRIDLIMGEEPRTGPNPPRLWKFSDYGYQSRSRRSTTTDTPGKVSFGTPHTSETPTKRKQPRTVTKRGVQKSECAVSSRLSALSRAFPQVFGFTTREDELNDLEIEFLEPLLDEDDVISELLHRHNPADTLLECLVFGVETLYGLSLLHNVAEMVHSDISPDNVMYSEGDSCWKLIDYGQCSPLNESLVTERTAGTEDYLCPESRRTGIFTPASDIFALGRVFIDVPVTVLIQEVLMYEPPGFTDFRPDAKCRSAIQTFSDLAGRMTDVDPSKRPNAHEALTLLFDTLELFDYDHFNPVLSAVRIFLHLERDEQG